MHIVPDMGWRQPIQLKSTCPSLVFTWLCDNGSLTQKLQHWSRAIVQVQVIEEKSIICPVSWKLYLGTHTGIVWKRTVLLSINGNAVIYAHSLLPTEALSTWARPLRFSHNRALGHILFSIPYMRRFGLRLRHQHNEWGRYSLFAPPEQTPILIQETFLSSLIMHITSGTTIPMAHLC